MAGMLVIPASQGLAGDVRSLQDLRARAATDPKGAIREAAKAFETLFMQEVLKSMRAATLATGMLENEGSKLGTDLLDQQLSTRLTGLPGGLSDAIARQLMRQLGVSDTDPRAPGASGQAPALQHSGLSGTLGAQGAKPASAADFVRQHAVTAQRAAAETGIPAEFMISQAALETGWGRREILHADGSSSHNLFGIKATASWKGPVAEVATTEYVDGQPQKVTARFRAYSSYAESFADYARLMKTSPRYAPVIAQGGTVSGFAQNLQRAGYATDPAYADKLTRVINTTLRLQRSQA
jgi:flagellar protein FlgJ